MEKEQEYPYFCSGLRNHDTVVWYSQPFIGLEGARYLKGSATPD